MFAGQRVLLALDGDRRSAISDLVALLKFNITIERTQINKYSDTSRCILVKLRHWRNRFKHLLRLSKVASQSNLENMSFDYRTEHEHNRQNTEQN